MRAYEQLAACAVPGVADPPQAGPALTELATRILEAYPHEWLLRSEVLRVGAGRAAPYAAGAERVGGPGHRAPPPPVSRAGASAVLLKSAPLLKSVFLLKSPSAEKCPLIAPPPIG